MAKTKSFHVFWDITERKIEVLQAAVIDDRQHAQVTKDGDVSNLTLAFSARDLYEQCKTGREKGLSDNQLAYYPGSDFNFGPKIHICIRR